MNYKDLLDKIVTKLPAGYNFRSLELEDYDKGKKYIITQS